MSNKYIYEIYEGREIHRTDVMFKLTPYCLSVTVDDLNLYRRYRYEDINILSARYFVLLESTLGAR